jgi:peptidoglycan/LPS O-acetylase OafA/YrhL
MIVKMLHHLGAWLSAYPFATASSAAFYVILIALATPSGMRVFASFLSHPVAPHQQYLQGFDSIRGVAAALIAIGHCWWATYPFFSKTQFALPFLAYDSKAVPIFATLSGFLIYRSVLAARTMDGLRSYAIRRFFRIYPVYVLGVLLCLLTGQYGIDPHAIASMFISDTFMFPLLARIGGFGNPPTWSLFVECQFYIMLPIIVLVITRRRMMFFCIVCICALLVADDGYRVFGLWKFFLTGILASELSEKIRDWRVALPAFLAGVGLLSWDFGQPTYGAHDWFADLGLTSRHLDGDTVGLGLACGMILLALPHLRSASRALDLAPLRLLGTISYSVYVTHFFYILANFPELGLFTNAGTDPMVKHFTSLPLMPAWYLPLIFFPGTLTWGLVSFVLVERPGMRLGRWIVNRSRVARAAPSVAPVDQPL